MKIYTKKQVTSSPSKDYIHYFMHDLDKGISLMVSNYSVFNSELPSEIAGTGKSNVFDTGCVIIDELEFHEAYDKAIESLQNFVP